MIKTILFDVDGVFLSEERCFDASALSVWELLYSKDYLGLQGENVTTTPSEKEIRSIRKTVFQDDDILNFVKDRGINSNWDMVFLTFSHQLLLMMKQLPAAHRQLVKDVLTHPIDQAQLQRIGEVIRDENLNFEPQFHKFVEHFSQTDVEKQALLLYLNELVDEWFEIETDIFSRTSRLWELGMSIFQEWYLGDTYFEQMMERPPQVKGKIGFLENEILLVELEEVQSLLRDLRNKGITLGIGTGRPFIETEVPFKAMGLWEYFDHDHIATATDVIRAETIYPEEAPLGKPQPFTYLKALYGVDSRDEKSVFAELPVRDSEHIMIVGDSVADLMAARSMGCTFTATLTGLSGRAARKTFEDLKADYICDDVLGLRRILL